MYVHYVCIYLCIYLSIYEYIYPEVYQETKTSYQSIYTPKYVKRPRQVESALMKRHSSVRSRSNNITAALVSHIPFRCPCNNVYTTAACRVYHTPLERFSKLDCSTTKQDGANSGNSGNSGISANTERYVFGKLSARCSRRRPLRHSRYWTYLLPGNTDIPAMEDRPRRV